MGQKLKNLVRTKLGWLIISGFLCVVFSILANFYDWAYTCMLLTLIYPTGLFLVTMVYAWIINPIREYKKK